MMQLWFITADINGDKDLLVEAKTEKRAIKLWRTYYELNDFYEDRDCQPELIFQVNPTGSEGVLMWHTPACKQVN